VRPDVPFTSFPPMKCPMSRMAMLPSAGLVFFRGLEV